MFTFNRWGFIVKLNSLYLAGILGIAVLAGPASAADMPAVPPAPVAPVPFLIFSDTSISYWHEFNAAEPGVGKHIDKEIVSVTHFDIWKYGTNFVNVDFLKSDSHDPAAPWGGLGYPIPPSGIGNGALEMYGFFRSTISWNSLAGNKMFSVGPLKDISFYFGANGNTKNTAFAPQMRDVVAGLQFTLGLFGTGFLNVSPVYYKEWNHNGIAPQLIVAGLCSPLVCSENVEFGGVFKLETNYAQPLGDLPLTIRGYTNVTMPKGNDGFGNATKTEIHTENRLVLDVGKIAGYKPNWIDPFVGYSYWRNKFGSDYKKDATGGSTESTVFVGITWHAL